MVPAGHVLFEAFGHGGVAEAEHEPTELGVADYPVPIGEPLGEEVDHGVVGLGDGLDMGCEADEAFTDNCFPESGHTAEVGVDRHG
jgi:hypothetical protein